jgi:hypothetical protein
MNADAIAETLHALLREQSITTNLNDAHREALCLIMNNIARLIAVDPNNRDYWGEIERYARLAAGKCDVGGPS